MRVVVFADWDHWVAQFLVEALLKTLSTYPTLRVVAVCVPRPTTHSRLLRAYARGRFVGWAKRLFLGDARYLRREPSPVSLQALARHYRFDVLVVPAAKGAQLAKWFHERLQPEVLLSIFWKRRFDAEFLALFKQSVNYHNGRVPDYRGLRATPWSLYRGEQVSGFTFHRISEQLDVGNVLVEGAVPIAAGASVFDVEYAKTRLAASHLRAVADAIAANDPGAPQAQPAMYNKVSDIARLRRIDEPASVSAAEVLRRIRAFGPIEVRLGDELLWISGLGAPDPSAGPSASRTLRLQDGTWRVKAADWRAHKLKRVIRRIISW